jgi:protein-disulfide isomerase
MTDDHRPTEAGAAGSDREPRPAADPTTGDPPRDKTTPTDEAVAPTIAEPAPTVPLAGGAAPRRSPPPVLGYLAAAIIGIAIGAIGLTLVDRSGAAGSPTPGPAGSPVPSVVPGLAAGAVGSPDAPATIEVWADYQCSFCRLEDLLFGGALDREYVMPGLVRIVYRDFAFLGRESVDAAIGARCAGRLEPTAQLRYHDALYTFQQGVNQGRFVRENLVQVAEIVGIADLEAFQACLDDPATEAAVSADLAQGRSLGIDSTPTLRLSGPGGELVLRGFSQAWPTLRDAVEGVLGRKPLPTPASTPSPTPATSPSPGTSAAPSEAPAATPSPAPSAAPSPSG